MERSSDRVSCLNRSKIRGNASAPITHAVVFHPHHRLGNAAQRLDADMSADFGVLGRVVEQVAEHLREPGGVAEDPRNIGVDSHLERVAAQLDERSRRVDCRGDHLLEPHRLHLQRDLSLGRTRNVEQIVHQPHELLHLAVHHLAQVRREARVQPAAEEDVERAPQRGQRVAQLNS